MIFLNALIKRASAMFCFWILAKHSIRLHAPICFKIITLWNSWYTFINNEAPHIKYLGVTSDHKLSWNEYIQNKAVQANAFMYQNLRYRPINIKCTCYKNMVSSIVEYALSVWDPYTIININKLEAIQGAGAKFCFNHFS